MPFRTTEPNMDKPIENSYCVLPGKVYAGEYPGDLHNPEMKVNQLVAFGITHFIDLTEDGELNPYSHLLPGKCTYYRFPIPDVSVPKCCEGAYVLLNQIALILADNVNKIYIHCWGGVGRTGTIAGCFYVFNGETCKSSITHLREQFKECPKSERRTTPETSEQIDFIKEFATYCKIRKA